MPTTQSKDTHATAAQPKPSVVPDGKSPLPTGLQDFPGGIPNDPGPSGTAAAATTPKKK